MVMIFKKQDIIKYINYIKFITLMMSRINVSLHIFYIFLDLP